MKFLKRLLDFYIQSSIHVGFAVFCLVKTTEITAKLHPIPFFSACVFFATILGYNFLKYLEVFRNGNFHSTKYYSILLASVFSCIGLFFTFINLKNTIQIFVLFSGLLVLLYPLLRKFGLVKLFFVSVVVTFITVCIPYANSKFLFLDYEVNLIQRLLLLSSLLIPFEIIDSPFDPISLQTIPQKFGINKTKLFGMLLVIPFIILEFLKSNSSLVSILIGLVTVILIHFSSIHRNKYYTSFWVESVPILWWVLVLVLDNL